MSDHLTAATSRARAVEGLFCAGHTFDGIVSAGEDRGWSRDDVLAVLKDRRWDLDGSGRIPRGKRVTSPPGLRVLPPPAPPAPGKAAGEKTSPAKRPAAVKGKPGPQPGSRRQPIAHGKPSGYFAHYRHKLPIPDDDSCGCRAAGNAYFRDQAAKKAAKKKVAAPSGETADAIPDSIPIPAPLPRQRERLAVAVELDEWFTEAQRSPSRAVQRAARDAVSALLQLRISMDELARAERAATSSRTTGEPT